MSLDAEILEQTFERVKPHATEFATEFYKILLTDYPQLQPLFANTNMEEQKKKLIMSLTLVVSNLRNPDYLTTILKELGERHVRYGAMREHYPIVGAALLKTFESYLGTDWTPNVKQAWTDAYGVIVNLMLSGAKYPEEVSKLEYALQQGAKPVVMAKASTQASASTSILNYSQKISNLENGAQPRVEPVDSSQKTTSASAPAPASSLNLKLLMLVFVVASLLGVGLFYYHSSSKPDNSSVQGSILKTPKI